MSTSTVRETRSLGIVGRDARTDELFALCQPDAVRPRAQVRVEGWWPGAGADLPSAATAIAQGSLAELLAMAECDLLFLTDDAAQDPVTVRAVAASGIEAVAFGPVAGDPNEVAALRVTSEVRATLTGAQGLASLARGDVGEVLAVYAGVRVPAVGAPGAALRRWLWSALDLSATATGTLPVRTYARADRLLSAERDHLQLLLRFPSDAIATIDLLELPGDSAVAEVDLEVTGRAGLLRLKPLAHRVIASSFAPPGATERRGWHPEAVRVLIDDLLTEPATTSQVAPHPAAAFVRWAAGLEALLANADEVLLEP